MKIKYKHEANEIMYIDISLDLLNFRLGREHRRRKNKVSHIYDYMY